MQDAVTILPSGLDSLTTKEKVLNAAMRSFSIYYDKTIIEIVLVPIIANLLTEFYKVGRNE